MKSVETLNKIIMKIRIYGMVQVRAMPYFLLIIL